LLFAPEIAGQIGFQRNFPVQTLRPRAGALAASDGRRRAPEVAISETLRVLELGGTIAFTSRPPHLMTGRAFALMGKYAPPLPPGVSPPVQWGDPAIVRERLVSAVKDLSFGSDTMFSQCLSPQHNRLFLEKNFGPAQKLITALEASDPAKAAELRREMEALASIYFENNLLRQDFLMT
jgi:hypothetical protein